MYTFSADGNEFDSFAGDEVEGFVDVGDFVEPHLASVWPGEGLAGNDLQQQHEFETIPEVLLDVLDLSAGFAQMRVYPSSESLETKSHAVVTHV